MQPDLLKREQIVPSFYYINMMDLKNTISQLLVEKFIEEDFSDCYLVELSTNNSNKIDVYVDSDSGMTVGKCAKISRYLERFLDEKIFIDTKYTLEVSSPGIDRPLIPRQYFKNIGRNIEIINDNNEIINGILESVDENGIVLVEKIKKEINQINIGFENIKEGKIIIKFNNKQK